MKMKETFDLNNSPFQGDRTVLLSRIPAGARIQRATAIVTPTAADAPIPFAETIKFTGPVGKFDGADISSVTKTVVSQQWVEVDFHGRQTLSQVKGPQLGQASLQVDFGGAFVEVNTNGGLRAPGDLPFVLSNSLNPPTNDLFALPGLAVSKLKLTRALTPPATADVTEMTIRSVPTNVSMRFGETPVFWTRVGELAQTETTPDFTASLQGFLADAKIENGFYVVPLVLHSDTFARLKVELKVEFLVEQSALPVGLNEVTLPYDFDGLPKNTPELLTITAPAGSRIVPQGSRARVVGSFADTRIVYNPIETVSPEGFVSTVKPAGKVTISPEDSFAQPISLAADIAATAIDLFLEIKQTVRLQLDLREDLDGKPGETSLLPKAVEVELAGPVGLEQSKGEQDRQRWISVPLPIEFQFKAADKQKRYWLTLQSLEGEADWSVATALPASPTIETLSLQRLSLRAADAALAWREATVSGVANPLAAFFRLRHLPKRFTMPVALQVGTGDSPVRADLSRYQDQGRVDFSLDFEQVEQARQKFLSNAAPMCAEIEYLANVDFEKWFEVKDKDGHSTEEFLPSDWTLTSGMVFPKSKERDAAFLVGFTKNDDLIPAALSQTAPIVGSCVYDFCFQAVATNEGTVAEIFWFGEACGLLRTDTVAIKAVNNAALFSSSGHKNFTGMTQYLSPINHCARLTAPPTAIQAEVRFSTPAGTALLLDRASLKGTTESIANEDLQQVIDGELVGWTKTPGLTVNGLKLSNTGRNAEDLAQTVKVKGDHSFRLEFEGNVEKSDQLPSLEIEWMKANDSAIGTTVKVELRSDSSGTAIAQGQSPKEATQAEIRFVLPPGSTLTVKKVSLRFPVMVSVPITFVAQAPGELAINDLQISFEDGDPMPPRIPEHGLCPPTPPGGQPGKGESDCAFCCCCGSEKHMVETRSAITDAGRPANLGNCADCGIEMVTFTGAIVADAPAFSRLRSAVRQPVVIRSEPARIENNGDNLTELTSEPQKIVGKLPKARKSRSTAGRTTPLITIKGIAEKRAIEFKKIGINSVEDLAAASPKTIAKLKGIPPAVSKKLIATAKKMTKPD